MITQQHIDEWTRHAPAAGPERDLIIAQRAAQLGQVAVVEQTPTLVERVANAIINSCGGTPEDWKPEACAAICEVAVALVEWFDSDEVVRTALEAAQWLEHEAQQ
jgi:ferritin-like metal-binding protein YciE